MSRADLLLLHAPSVFDFRERSIMFGPVSDLVPSTPVFEMYPIGMTTLAEYLERHGHKVRIVNLAVLMLRKPKFDAYRYLRSIEAPVVGIDLHWLPHAQGAIEVARLVKRFHPGTKVLMGGLSATYYHEELILEEAVDLVLRGDSTEEPARMLLEALAGGGDLGEVPNLTWKDRSGAVRVNPLSWVPSHLNDVSLDYSFNMRSAVRNRDLVGQMPFRDWLDYPACAALTSRGCRHDCATCGGSRFAYRNHFGRSEPAFRDPALVAGDIAHIQQHIPGPVFVLNDPFQAGDDYARELFREIGLRRPVNPVAFEFFRPPDPAWWEYIAAHIPGFSAEISLESHDEGVRRKMGKPFSNAEFERSLEVAMAHGCRRFDIYFMTGLPTQTYESILGTVDYVRSLNSRFGDNPDILPFISPMAPTLDPGSRVFEAPERFGYKLRARTLAEHRELLTQPSWKHILNYEPDAMTRDELVEGTYEAALGLTKEKARIGSVRESEAAVTASRVAKARRVMERIDEIVLEEPVRREARLIALKYEVDRVNESTVCEKRELNWPARVRPAMVFNVLALWLRETVAGLFVR